MIYSLGISIVCDDRRVPNILDIFCCWILDTFQFQRETHPEKSNLSRSIHVDTLYIFSAIPDPSWIPIFSRDIRHHYASPIFLASQHLTAQEYHHSTSSSNIITILIVILIVIIIITTLDRIFMFAACDILWHVHILTRTACFVNAGVATVSNRLSCKDLQGDMRGVPDDCEHTKLGRYPTGRI